ncbi:FAD-binding oxidoreductase [Vogesella indigofera]|uniref:FAD-binding oxidoreductase n=1 Tax=Vogesella indigofera TaxID=45465 RepID=UPI00234E0ABD|nr:FAD-binding oxidoreductase [Vogesella indigofera]MDC7704485.1 FAD-binding oxidoreductase [Vogesella indigofera]
MLAPQQLAELGRLLAADRVATDTDTLTRYGLDWTRYFTPDAAAVLFPKTVDEVVALVRWAQREQFALVPSGGRTGLSGGAVARNGELVVSFERMNAILELDKVGRTVRCQAGVITKTLQEFALANGLYYPVDFASSGSSQIGGNIATNAGGIKVVRYGMTREWVVGLKVVTGEGEVLELNHGLAKNNTGYDFRHLFIGSEGTLGFIVEATLRLARPPAELAVMVLAVPQLADIMNIFNAYRDKLDLTAFEFFSEQALRHVLARGTVQRPFDEAADYYVLLEFEKIAPDTETQALALFEYCAEQGWLVDGVLSQSQQQAAELWRLREDISESITPYKPYKNDIAVVVSKVPAFVAQLDEILAREYPQFEVVWFGHIGDGNLHINVLKPEALAIDDFRRACEQVNKYVFELVRDFNGSMSAEHGVGLLKHDYLDVSRSHAEIRLMKAMKSLFDPDGIMNPGKLV